MVFKSGRTAPQTEGIENNAAVMIWEDDAVTQNVVIIFLSWAGGCEEWISGST